MAKHKNIMPRYFGIISVMAVVGYRQWRETMAGAAG